MPAATTEFRERYHRLQALRSQPHFVYRVYDADDALLYVGCTRVPQQRFAGHMGASEWWPQAVRAEWVAHPDFRSARTAEGEAIRAERPLFNRNGWRDPKAGS